MFIAEVNKDPVPHVPPRWFNHKPPLRDCCSNNQSATALLPLLNSP